MSTNFKPCEVEPWKISKTGKVTRVPKSRAKLNLRQERFVFEYLKDGNGTRAAIKAGYAASSAAVHACRLLQHERVQEEIRAHRNRVQDGNDVLVKRTLRELGAIAFADPGELFDRKGNLLPLTKNDASRALERLNIQYMKGGRKVRTIEVQFADRMPALIALMKHLGMIPVRG